MDNHALMAEEGAGSNRIPAALRFPMAGAVTGIGSLPFTRADDAIHAIAELCPEVPFWPQLPRRSERESIIGQGLGSLAGLIEPRTDGYGYRIKAGRLDDAVEVLHHGDGALSDANAVGFSAFEDALTSGFFPFAKAVKGQIEGPVTLAAYLYEDNRPFLSDSALLSAIVAHVSRMACWQVDRLRAAGLPIMLFVDEPALGIDMAGCEAVPEEQRLAAVNTILASVREHDAIAGLHCCAATPFEGMCRAEPDVISFDASQSIELFFASAAVRRFLRNGGCVAYGLVPTLERLDGGDRRMLCTRWLSAASTAGDVRDLARRAMVTATCGLGLLNVTSVTPSFQLAREIGQYIRRLAAES